MADRPVFVDASLFLGMHHAQSAIRQQSIAIFCRTTSGELRMNYEQIGICDAVIWRESRYVQDLYYPFMDRLHSELAIVRAGYSLRDLQFVVESPELRGIRPEQGLLAAQVLQSDGLLATHDPRLRDLRSLQAHLWKFERGPSDSGFPPALGGLYEVSLAFVHRGGETLC